MALLNFPDPGVTPNYTANGNSWEWNGTSWVSANNLDLANQVTGVLATVYGGTGKALSGMTVGSVIYADTSSSFAALSPGTNNYVLATQEVVRLHIGKLMILELEVLEVELHMDLLFILV